MPEQCKKNDVARVAEALERLDAAIRTNHEHKPVCSFVELDQVLNETLAPVCDSPLIRHVLEDLLGHCQADVLKRVGSFPSFKSDKTPSH
jgi:DNA-binding GntR family transcriptional regulator